MWIVVTYIPMPPLFRTVIMVLAVVFVLLYLMTVFGVTDIPIPRLNR